MSDPHWTPLIVWICSLQVLLLSQSRAPSLRERGINTLFFSLTGITCLTPDPQFAVLLSALMACMHAILCRRTSTAGSRMLLFSAMITWLAGLGLVLGHGELSFALVLVALLVRGGIWPLHGGVRSLCDSAMTEQIRQLATLLPLVLVHLRHLDHVDLATRWADDAVRIGSVSTLAAAVGAVLARDLRSFLGLSMAMHGGILMVALGAAGRGHYGAALFAALTLSLALSGQARIAESLFERLGNVSLSSFHGAARSFPRLSAGFLFFGAAGVGMPGTAGFIADDLLLHALWEESTTGTIFVILASATLAIATWTAATRIFFGSPRESRLSDLAFHERLLGLGTAALLVLLGFAPRLLMDSANQLLGAR